MKITDIRLRQRLTDVEHTASCTDTFICPANFTKTVTEFLDAYHIRYTLLKNSRLYPKEDMELQLSDYRKYSYFSEEADVIITSLDRDSLFAWASQLFGDDADPAFLEYLAEQNVEIEEYYQRVQKQGG